MLSKRSLYPRWFLATFLGAALGIASLNLPAQAACTNPSPLPTGFAAPCPVWSLSASSVSQSGTLTLSATPQAGTDYILTTAYISQGTIWNPYTLQGNNAVPSYSSALASLTLSSAQLSSLSLGTHYAVVWDWLWDATAQCYKGPGLNQCNTGEWRAQTFTITSTYAYSQSAYYAYSQSSYYTYSQSSYVTYTYSQVAYVTSTPTPSPTSSPSPSKTPSGPITITSANNGQTFQNLKITSTTGDCVTVTGANNITIQNVEIGPCGTNNTTANSRGIAISGSTGVNVYDSYIHVQNLASVCDHSHDGIVVTNSAGPVTIQGNVIGYNQNNVTMWDVSNVSVIGNYIFNPRGSATCASPDNLQGHQVQAWADEATPNSNITYSNT